MSDLGNPMKILNSHYFFCLLGMLDNIVSTGTVSCWVIAIQQMTRRLVIFTCLFRIPAPLLYPCISSRQTRTLILLFLAPDLNCFSMLVQSSLGLFSPCFPRMLFWCSKYRRVVLQLHGLCIHLPSVLLLE